MFSFDVSALQASHYCTTEPTSSCDLYMMANFEL